MAYQRGVSAVVVLVVLSGLAAIGLAKDTGMECENMSSTSCAFAVDSHGTRCVLETSIGEDGGKMYHCQTSDFRSSKSEEYVESDSCVEACGVNRMTVGISTDEFFLPSFVDCLCSLKCQMECPNIVDLFSSIVASAAKGASLGKFCSDHLASHDYRRQMRANPISTSGLASFNGISPISSFAAGPTSSSDGFADAPTSNGLSEDADSPTSSFFP